jgi:hypothetical protein
MLTRCHKVISALMDQIPRGRWTTKDALSAAAAAWVGRISESTLQQTLLDHPFCYRVLRKKHKWDHVWVAFGRNEEDRAIWRSVLNEEIPGLKWNTDLEETTFSLEVTDEFFWQDFCYQDFIEG